LPLNIHPKCRERLDESLPTALAWIKAQNGMFIDRLSTAHLMMADFILPQTGGLHDRLVEYLDEFPLSEFVLDTLGQELWELDQYISDKTLKLPEIAIYADTKDLSNRLLDAFETLPWHYQLTIPLPAQLNKLLDINQFEIVLSPEVRIVRPNDACSAQFPLETLVERRSQRLKGYTGGFLSLLGDPEPAKWQDDWVCLQIAAEGFVGQYGGSPTAHKAERLLSSFCGLGLATRLFKWEHTYSATPFKAFAFVHRRLQNDNWEAVTRYDLNDLITRGLAGLKLHDLEGYLGDEAKLRSWAHYRIADMGTVFVAGERSDPITLASQWLFDSYCGQDQLLSFIQAMVVLEILLGNKSISDEIGIGELISNRFAYLIGTTHEERAELLKAFKDIYRVRSQIVHSGKHKLTLAERSLFSRLRWMCRRAIDKEVDLLKAGTEKEKPAMTTG
jgi:hypothetical protein